MRYSFPEIDNIEKVMKFFGLLYFLILKNKVKTYRNLYINKSKKIRLLEVGPGLERIEGFETLNIINSSIVDYIIDISKGETPFEDSTFDLIYCSHLIEHIPWYNVEKVFNEFNRILKPNGRLEIWVPDAYKICKILVDYEDAGIDNTSLDGWYRFNEKKDPVRWAAGRIFTYGDGLGSLCHHNWHRGLFTEKYLKRIFSNSGFLQIETMANNEVRGYNHGWINLGVKGIKR